MRRELDNLNFAETVQIQSYLCVNIRSLNFEKKNWGVRFYVKHIQISEGARQYKWENRDCLYSMIYLNSCGKIFTSSAIRKHLKNMQK